MRSYSRLPVIIASLAVSCLFLGAPAGRAESTPGDSEVDLRVMVSSSYVYNLNRPADRVNRLRVFDSEHNAIKLDVAQLSLQRLPAAPGEAGFRVDLVAGHSIPPAVAADPSREIDVHQAFVSWIAPVGAGLKVEAGKFATHLGYEVIEGVDGWNEQVSRSFLFGYAIPFLHTGARASLTLAPGISVMGGVVNGWDNHHETNSSKTMIGQIALTPAEGISVAANGIYGPELAGDDGRGRFVIDLVGSYAIAPGIKLGANFDLGREDGPAPAKGGTDGELKWMGVAGYLRYQAAPKVYLNLRGELMDDADGARTGIEDGVKLTEVTFTPEYRVSDQMAIRAELRLDQADERVFAQTTDGKTEAKKTQPTFGLNWVCTF